MLSSTSESVLLTSTRWETFPIWLPYRLRLWRTVLATAAFGERSPRLTEPTESCVCSSVTTCLLSPWERPSAWCSTPAVCNWWRGKRLIKILLCLLENIWWFKHKVRVEQVPKLRHLDRNTVESCHAETYLWSHCEITYRIYGMLGDRTASPTT